MEGFCYIMDANLLRYFLAVVDTGTFTKAADACFVTQPSLSAGIKKLEDSLGAKLFERSSRRVFLTETGVRLLPRARTILQEINNAYQVVSDRSRIILKVGFLTTLANRKVSHLLSSFSKSFPECLIEVVDGTEHELLNRLDEHRIQVAVTIDRSYQSSRTRFLQNEGYRIIFAKGHSFAGLSRLKPKDLMQEAMVVRSKCEILPEASRFFTDNNLRPRLVYRTSNDGRAVSMVAAGVGATIVPESWIDDRVAAFDLEGFEHSRKLITLRPIDPLPEATTDIVKRFEDHIVHLWGQD